MTGSFTLSKTGQGWLVGRFSALQDVPGIVHLVTTRAGPRLAARADAPATVAAMQTIGSSLGLSQVAWSEQVHGAAVLEVSQGGPAGPADGLISASRGLGILGRSADCPLVLVAMPIDRSGPSTAAWAFGMAHASWRSTLARITARTIERLGRLPGAEPPRAIACIAPSAGPCCYEVGQDLRQEALARLGPGAGVLFRQQDGRLYLDLWRANVEQLRSQGLAADNIHVAGICTICGADLFPSYRQEGQGASRFAAIIGHR